MRILIIIFLILTSISFSQDSLFKEKDLVKYLFDFHPELQQYKLMLEQAQSNILKNRGAFDPKIYSNFNNKSFNDKEYYSILNGGLNIPVYYGFDINANFDLNNGDFLNPQNSLPNNGLYAVGVNLPILQGLFYDARRANLNSAKNFSNILEAQQIININDLFFEALNSFWDWVEAYNILLIKEYGLKLTEERFINTRDAFLFGDKPAVDTLESYIQLNDRIMQVQQARIDEFSARLQLNNFIWNNQNSPIILSNISAVNYSNENIFINNIIDTNSIDYNSIPEISILNSNQKENEIQRRLKLEKLKPKLDLKYNFISENIGQETINNFNTDNYTWGLKFEMPVLLREARGDLQLADIKIEQTNLKLSQKLFEIENKLKSNFIEFSLLSNQVDVINRIAIDYELLLEAEKTKFFNGESSIFLVNSRELKLIEYRIKQIEVKKKTILTYYKYLKNQGILVDYLNQ